MIVKVDVDGVIRDVMSAICRISERDFGERVLPSEIVRYDRSGLFHEARRLHGNLVDYFFHERGHEVLLTEARCFQRAKEAIELLRGHGHRVIIVTYQLSPRNMRYPLEFLEREGICYHDIMFTREKHLVDGHFIIDDAPFVFPQNEPEERIIIDAPYNRCLPDGAGIRFASLYEASEYICQKQGNSFWIPLE